MRNQFEPPRYSFPPVKTLFEHMGETSDQSPIYPLFQVLPEIEALFTVTPREKLLPLDVKYQRKPCIFQEM